METDIQSPHIKDTREIYSHKLQIFTTYTISPLATAFLDMLYCIYNAYMKYCFNITAPIIAVLVGIERYTTITSRNQNVCFELYSFRDRVSSMKSAIDLEIYIQGQGMTSRLTKKPGSLGHPSTLNQRPKQCVGSTGDPWVSFNYQDPLF